MKRGGYQRLAGHARIRDSLAEKTGWIRCRCGWSTAQASKNAGVLLYQKHIERERQSQYMREYLMTAMAEAKTRFANLASQPQLTVTVPVRGASVQLQCYRGNIGGGKTPVTQGLRANWFLDGTRIGLNDLVIRLEQRGAKP